MTLTLGCHRVLIGKRHNGTVESVAAQPVRSCIRLVVQQKNGEIRGCRGFSDLSTLLSLKSSLAVYTGSGGVVNALSWPQEATLFRSGTFDGPSRLHSMAFVVVA
eukprot:TRINITY_DN9683_c0_g2_i1.p1 TRINITY_DN9683_c0_g2~~TRINITY_DN9683_c0_g2_i1.p1  ORF type:complete len:105 (-),score=5.58 TRINITY_DN9683_c0_g2_i1:592-906(-)